MITVNRDVFHAIAEATRRSILQMLLKEDLTPNTIAGINTGSAAAAMVGHGMVVFKLNINNQCGKKRLGLDRQEQQPAQQAGWLFLFYCRIGC